MRRRRLQGDGMKVSTYKQIVVVKGHVLLHARTLKSSPDKARFGGPSCRR